MTAAIRQQLHSPALHFHCPLRWKDTYSTHSSVPFNMKPVASWSIPSFESLVPRSEWAPDPVYFFPLCNLFPCWDRPRTSAWRGVWTLVSPRPDIPYCSTIDSPRVVIQRMGMAQRGYTIYRKMLVAITGSILSSDQRRICAWHYVSDL